MLGTRSASTLRAPSATVTLLPERERQPAAPPDLDVAASAGVFAELLRRAARTVAAAQAWATGARVDEIHGACQRVAVAIAAAVASLEEVGAAEPGSERQLAWPYGHAPLLADGPARRE